MHTSEESQGEAPPPVQPTESDAALAAVMSLAQALDMRDVATASHSRTVARYSEQIARELGLSQARTERIRLAGMLHDIGKIGVPDSILQKPGPLTEVEWSDMKRHPTIGARIVAQNSLEDIGEWILAHHERPDGQGYPRGLPESEIPLEARILAVADAYEAMIARRPYRPPLGPGLAREELRRWAGSQFDRRVVEVFLHWLERREDGARAGRATRSHRGDDGGDDRWLNGDDRWPNGDDRWPNGDDPWTNGDDRWTNGDHRRTNGDDRRPHSQDLYRGFPAACSTVGREHDPLAGRA